MLVKLHWAAALLAVKQVSVVHMLLSLQLYKEGVHTLLTQVSGAQGFVQVHAVVPHTRQLPATGVCVQFPLVAQASLVQGLLSSQFLSTWAHPLIGSQESAVHALSSSQLIAGYWQTPPTQLSLVHTLLSLQTTGTVTLQAPELGSQLTGKHRLPPSGAQEMKPVPLAQWLHAWGSWTHPVAGAQESAVQGLLSLQLIGANTQPDPVLQLSAVQALLSLQVITGCSHPTLGSQVSFVHALVSAQLTTAYKQPAFMSHEGVVHMSPLLQLTGVCMQPFVASQESVVQALESSQEMAVVVQPEAGLHPATLQALAVHVMLV
jgi:hypothetical protein